MTTDKAPLEPPAGVPLGGIGAGCIEFGPDGRCRNLTINNNRTADSRIADVPHTFWALRIQDDDRTTIRLLQETADFPLEHIGFDASCLARGTLQYEGLYPVAAYRWRTPEAPVALHWRFVGPIVPYDADISTLPVIQLAFDITNTSADPLQADILLNWENLSGCSHEIWPVHRGQMRPLIEDVGAVSTAESGEETTKAHMLAGLEMGHFRDFADNAHGNYAIIALPRDKQTISVTNWNPQDAQSSKAFWEAFGASGHLGDEVDDDPQKHCGALCVSTTLAPRETATVHLAIGWYCPRFVVNGHDQGNHYATSYRSAAAVARHALRYRPYVFEAVTNWHQRVMRASLPLWFRRMLINSNYVLSTNSLYTKDGRFALFETPADPRMGCLDRRFHSSLGTLLFFPNLAYNELDQFARAEPSAQPGRLYRYLGSLNIADPDLGDDKGELLDLTAKFILMVYRDYRLTGRTADLNKLYPRLHRAMAYFLEKDRDGDGLPEVAGFTTTFDSWRFFGVDSYSGSLWIAALKAFAELERAMGHAQRAEWCEQLLERARTRFEKRLWNEAQGYYYLHDNTDAIPEPNEPIPHGCISGQLAGQWYADFMGLGCLFPVDHIKRALKAIYAVHERAGAKTSWPAFHLTHYACLEILHGSPDRGLQSVRRIYELIDGRDGQWVFNQPLCWNLDTGAPTGWGTDRHMGAPAIWHVLYALQGFLLNVPDQELWIRPHLPKGVHLLETPLITPLSMGWLRYREGRDDNRYQQFVQIVFDSPVHIQTLVLGLPQGVDSIALRVEGPDGCDNPAYAVGTTGGEQLVEIRFRRPITTTEPLTVQIRQTMESSRNGS